MARKPEDALPKKYPKKTGSRGIGPKPDPEDVVSKLNKMDPEPKGTLLVKQPPKPVVVGTRMKTFYDKPSYGKLPSGKVTIALQCSMVLEDVHKPLLPKIVSKGYSGLSEEGRTALMLADLPGHFVEFFIDHDDDTPMLTMPAAKVTHVALRVIQRKGEGSARKVVRLSFRLQVMQAADVSRFADMNLNNDYWMTLGDPQGKLFDEEAKKK